MGVRDHLPLQQGLRLQASYGNVSHSGKYETIFHYNKD